MLIKIFANTISQTQQDINFQEIFRYLWSYFIAMQEIYTCSYPAGQMYSSFSQPQQDVTFQETIKYFVSVQTNNFWLKLNLVQPKPGLTRVSNK